MPLSIHRNNPQFQSGIHLVCFMLLFLCGIFLANLKLSEETFRIGFQITSFLKQPPERPAFLSLQFLQMFKDRLILWLVLCLTGYFHRSSRVYPAVTAWFGFSFGLFSTALIRTFGIRSFPLLFGILLPHLPFYLAAYILLIKNRIHRNPVYFLKCLLLSLLCLCGLLCECCFSPIQSMFPSFRFL